MSLFPKLRWRFKFPLLALSAQFLVLAALEFFFPKSDAQAVKLAFLIVAYPFLHSLLLSSAWLLVLYWIGWGIEGSVKKKPDA